MFMVIVFNQERIHSKISLRKRFRGQSLRKYQTWTFQMPTVESWTVLLGDGWQYTQSIGNRSSSPPTGVGVQTLCWDSIMWTWLAAHVTNLSLPTLNPLVTIWFYQFLNSSKKREKEIHTRIEKLAITIDKAEFLDKTILIWITVTLWYILIFGKANFASLFFLSFITALRHLCFLTKFEFCISKVAFSYKCTLFMPHELNLIVV